MYKIGFITSEVCKMCTNRLIVRSANGKKFLGCSGWPRCKFTKKYPEAFKMTEAGQPSFPGL